MKLSGSAYVCVSFHEIRFFQFETRERERFSTRVAEGQTEDNDLRLYFFEIQLVRNRRLVTAPWCRIQKGTTQEVLLCEAVGFSFRQL